MALSKIHTKFQVFQHDWFVYFLPCSMFLTFHNIIKNIQSRLLFANLKKFWKGNSGELKSVIYIIQKSKSCFLNWLFYFLNSLPSLFRSHLFLTTKAMPKLPKAKPWKPVTISKYGLQFLCTKHIFLNDFKVPETEVMRENKSPQQTEKSILVTSALM